MLRFGRYFLTLRQKNVKKNKQSFLNKGRYGWEKIKSNKVI